MYSCSRAVAKRFDEKTTTVRREREKMISHRGLFAEDKQPSGP